MRHNSYQRQHVPKLLEPNIRQSLKIAHFGQFFVEARLCPHQKTVIVFLVDTPDS